MVHPNNILISKKSIGKYESVILEKLITFFQNAGYSVIPHARFNISWGAILSDVDLLLLKNSEITLVEIKSSRDKLHRAIKQIETIEDYVDYVYVATDYLPKKFPFPTAGWIYVNGSVNIVKEPKPLTNKPKFASVYSIPKKCLCRMGQIKNIKLNKNTNKSNITQKILNDVNTDLKDELKEIVTCGLHCEDGCPIWKFDNSNQSYKLDLKFF